MKFNKYNDCYNIIGTKLKEIREEQNISQYELSNKLALLGITLYQSDIFKIEKIKEQFEILNYGEFVKFLM